MVRKLVGTLFACGALLYLNCTNPSSSDGDEPIFVTADLFEPDNIQASAKQIKPDNLSQSRTIKAEDIDWVYFSGVSGKSYKIFTTGNIDSRIQVYSASSSVVPILEGDDSPGSSNASVVLNCSSSATFYVCVSGSSVGVAGSYSLSVITLDGYEDDSSPKLARALSTSVQSHSLTEGDVDWVSCYMAVSDTVLFTATGTCRTTMVLYDRDSVTQLTTAPVTESVSQIKYHAATSGTYFLKISARVSTDTGSYQLTMQTSSNGTLVTPDAYEIDNTRSTAKILPGISAVQSRSLTVKDTDWVRLPVAIGRQYSLNFTSSSSIQATMYAKDGTILQGPSYSLLLNSSATDTVYIKMNSIASSAVNYSLSLSVLLQPSVPDEYEVDNTKALAKVKYVDSDTFIQDRTLTYSPVADTDWVAFPVFAGKKYTFKTTTSSATTLYMYLYDNQSLSYINSSPSLSSFIYTPLVSDTMYLMIRSAASSAIAYSLSVQGQFANDTFEPDSSRTTAKAITTSIQNHILLPNDTDWVIYTSTPGDSFVVQTTGTTDTKLFLFSSSGSTPLVENDDIGSSNTNSMISWKSTLGGQFYIRVIGKTPKVNGSYVLQVLSVLSGTLLASDSFENDNNRSDARIILDSVLVAEVHSLTMNDTDCIGIPVVAGGQYTVNASSSYSLNMYLYSSRDSLIISRVSYSSPSIVYLAPRSDTLYYRVTSSSSTTVPSYSLYMSRLAPPSPDLYEVDNNKATARIILDTVVTAEVHSITMNDTDWVAFPILAGGQYTVSASSSASISMYLYTSRDSFITSRVSYSSPSLSYTTLKNDTLYCKVISASASVVQRYTLSFSRIAPQGPDLYEVDNTKAMARIILDTVLSAEVHSLSLNDTDWVAFPVLAGGQYTVSASSSYSLNMYLYSSRDSLIISRVNYSSPSIAYVAPKNDTLYYKITSNSVSTVPRYTLSMSRIAPQVSDLYEIDNTKAKARIILDTLISAEVHSLTLNDTDWVAFPVFAGGQYTVSVSSNNSLNIYLYSSRDSLIISRVNYLTTLMAYTAPKNDTLYCKVISGSTSTVPRYTLSMSRVAPPSSDLYEIDNTKAFARIILDSEVNAEVHSLTMNDTDWVAFPVLAGGKYTVSASSSSTPLNMYLYSSRDSLIYSRVSYSSPSIAYTTPKNDTLYYKITSSSVSTVPRYTLSMSRIAPPNPDLYEIDNSRDVARLISLESLQSRTLTQSDTDWFKIYVTSGSTYEVTTSASMRHYTYLYLGVSTSTSIYASDIANTLSITPAASDTLYIHVRQYSTGSSYWGPYTLKVTK